MSNNDAEQNDAEQEDGPETIEPAAKALSFPVVGIGASAGGLEALEGLFVNMPDDPGMAFVVVTHQHPGHASMLPELLAKRTKMPVVEAADGAELERDHVYVGPPGADVTIVHGILRCEKSETKVPRLPIDALFRSLAEDQKERAIGVVLSGTGTDGTVGAKTIKGESGMVMVEQPSSAKYAGMPSSAIATGLVDYVLPPADMPSALIAYARGPYLTAAAVASELPPVPPEPMQKIFVLLRSRTGHDFSGYKSNTLRRRIERRMNVHCLENPTDYVRYLQENPHEIDFLFKELLITVSNFFRDPAAWDALDPHLETLLRSRPDHATIRAWIPGCATGEEVYSLAIALRDVMDRIGRHFEVQIFGTDLNAQAIETARAGRYPDGIALDLSAGRSERYFVRGDGDGTYRIRNEIREMTVFALQNVIKDPPFTKLDILSCRNLLIYLSSNLQKTLIPIFHYALRREGLLFLGPSETIGAFSDLFDPLDKRWKIFRRKESVAVTRALPRIPAQPRVGDEPDALPTPIKQAPLSTLLVKLLLERFTPASVVVSESGDIVYINGRTGAYLEPAPGVARSNIVEMAREGLQIELAAALRESIRTGNDVTRSNVRVKTNGKRVPVDLSVVKLQEPESVRGLLLVTFRRAAPVTPEPSTGKRKRKRDGDGERIEQLEIELRHMQESHRSTLEELETSNEELKSTNEELQSTNEELQSSNEELETSKEEMQSLNEELTTVNAELESKVDDLAQSNDDMQNLLNSTDIATVFLDDELNIKRFTEQATQLVRLRASDAGRPISELASNLTANDLTADCHQVLKTLLLKESEVETNDGRQYLMRILPYRTADNVIEGLVLTFVDIGRLKAGEKARDYFESIVNTVREPLIVLDQALRVHSANQSFYRTFRTSPKHTEGQLIYELGAGQWDIDSLREMLENLLPAKTVEDYRVDVNVPQLGHRVFVLNARRLEQADGETDLILVAMEDQTEQQ